MPMEKLQRIKIVSVLDPTEIRFGGIVKDGPHDGEAVTFTVPIKHSGAKIRDAFTNRTRDTDVYVEVPAGSLVYPAE